MKIKKNLKYFCTLLTLVGGFALQASMKKLSLVTGSKMAGIELSNSVQKVYPIGQNNSINHLPEYKNPVSNQNSSVVSKYISPFAHLDINNDFERSFGSLSRRDYVDSFSTARRQAFKMIDHHQKYINYLNYDIDRINLVLESIIAEIDRVERLIEGKGLNYKETVKIKTGLTFAKDELIKVKKDRLQNIKWALKDQADFFSQIKDNNFKGSN